jgi:hypothetical protein
MDSYHSVCRKLSWDDLDRSEINYISNEVNSVIERIILQDSIYQQTANIIFDNPQSYSCLKNYLIHAFSFIERVLDQPTISQDLLESIMDLLSSFKTNKLLSKLLADCEVSKMLEQLDKYTQLMLERVYPLIIALQKLDNEARIELLDLLARAKIVINPFEERRFTTEQLWEIVAQFKEACASAEIEYWELQRLSKIIEDLAEIQLEDTSLQLLSQHVAGIIEGYAILLQRLHKQ